MATSYCSRCKCIRDIKEVTQTVTYIRHSFRYTNEEIYPTCSECGKLLIIIDYIEKNRERRRKSYFEARKRQHEK